MPKRSMILVLAMVMLGLGITTPVFARDINTEEKNRQLVIHFYDQFFNEHNVDAASVIADDYIQHNPDVKDGKKPFVDYFTLYLKEHPESKARIIRSAADGDLVYLHVHSTINSKDRGQAVIDIFRVKDGKITEHWDVIQPVPETAANNNTMF